MDFLIDYLPAIQFAAALNIGYIIPDIMAKMNSVLNNINNGYVRILQDVRSRIVLKSQEINGICIIKTDDKRTNKGFIDKQLQSLKTLKEGCDAEEQSLETMINSYVNCSGYRSVFFYSALFSVFELLIIPFCHQHGDVWAFRVFFYWMNSTSLLFLLGLFIKVIYTKKDVSCRSVFGIFMLLLLISTAVAYINNLLPSLIEVGVAAEIFLASFSAIISFIPGAGCMVFLMVLVYYATIIARLYSIRASFKFRQINKSMKKLNIIDEIFEEEVTVE